MVEYVYEVDLAKELGINPRHLSRIRKKHLATDDWKRVGSKQQVFLTKEGEIKYRLYAECRKSEPQLLPTFVEVRVLEQCPNPAWVRAKVEFPEGGWRKVDVAIPRRLTGRLVGKMARVEVIRDASGESYRHESLSSDYE